MKKIKSRMLFVIVLLLVFCFNTFSQVNAAKDSVIVIKRFLVERTFPSGLNIPVNEEGSKICFVCSFKKCRR